MTPLNNQFFLHLEALRSLYLIPGASIAAIDEEIRLTVANESQGICGPQELLVRNAQFVEDQAYISNLLREGRRG